MRKRNHIEWQRHVEVLKGDQLFASLRFVKKTWQGESIDKKLSRRAGGEAEVRSSGVGWRAVNILGKSRADAVLETHPNLPHRLSTHTGSCNWQQKHVLGRGKAASFSGSASFPFYHLQ